jgi:phospholipid/cholesterol/gamma-HCH transport system permease protein
MRAEALRASGARLLVAVGDGIFRTFETVADFVDLVWDAAKASVSRPFYGSLALAQFHALIVKSTPLVVLTALSTGAVMALQFGQGMGRFGGKLYVPTVVAVSIVRALGPIFTSLMVAGRVGAGVAAEMGGMTVTQQVDAIRALGTDPVRKLVVPRVVVLALGLPLLTLLADVVGILGGLLVAGGSLDISPELYLRKSLEAVRLEDLVAGTGKTALFGAFIGLIATFNGLRTKEGTIGIGAAATRTVVGASLFIMVSDVLITKLLWAAGY